MAFEKFDAVVEDGKVGLVVESWRSYLSKRKESLIAKILFQEEENVRK